MNNKIKIMIIGVVSYFLISLIVLVINNSNRYIIVSNDFMFKVSNKSIKKVDKYPKYCKWLFEQILYTSVHNNTIHSSQNVEAV